MTKEEVLKLLNVSTTLFTTKAFEIGNFIIELAPMSYPEGITEILSSSDSIETFISSASSDGFYEAIYPFEHPSFKDQKWAEKFYRSHTSFQGDYCNLSLSEVIEVFQHCARLNKLSAFYDDN